MPELNLQSLQIAILDAVNDLREANIALRDAGIAWAERDTKYRRSKAIAYLATSGTVAERQAHVDRTCEKEMLEAHAAECAKEAAKELVRSLVTTISAFQSLLSSHKIEAELSKY